MAVVGLDFGNLSVLIGQAGRGGVDVILNDSSNRQTASYVSIQGKQRFLGDSGSAMVSNRNGNCNDTSSHDSQITPWHFVDTFPDQLRYRHSIQTVSDLYRQHLMQFSSRVNTSTWSNSISRQGQTLPTRFTAWNNSWDGNLIPQMFRKVRNNSSFISWCISGRVSQRWLNDDDHACCICESLLKRNHILTAETLWACSDLCNHSFCDCKCSDFTSSVALQNYCEHLSRLESFLTVA